MGFIHCEPCSIPYWTFSRWINLKKKKKESFLNNNQMAKCLWWWANAAWWRNCHKIVNSWQFRQEVFLLWSHIPLSVFVFFHGKEKTKQHWSLVLHWPYVQVHFVVWCPARRDAFSIEFSYLSEFISMNNFEKIHDGQDTWNGHPSGTPAIVNACFFQGWI